MTDDKNKSSRNKTVLLLLFILPGIVGLYLLFMTFNGPPPKPALPYYGITSTNDTLQLPDFSFTNQLGQIISKDSLRDKIKIIHFFNTNCTNGCIEVVKNLVEVQDYFKVGEDVHILSFTTDADNDQPAVLQKFGEQNEINNRQWAFLTAIAEAQKVNLQQFLKHSFFSLDKEVVADLSGHQKLILVDKAGKIRGYYDGMDEAQTQRLSENVEVLKLTYGTQEKYR